jgi:hypothetical protein
MPHSASINAVMAAATQFDFLASRRLPDPRAVIGEAARLVRQQKLAGRIAWLRAAAAQVALLPPTAARHDLQEAIWLLARLMIEDGQMTAPEGEAACQLMHGYPPSLPSVA